MQWCWFLDHRMHCMATQGLSHWSQSFYAMYSTTAECMQNPVELPREGSLPRTHGGAAGVERGRAALASLPRLNHKRACPCVGQCAGRYLARSSGSPRTSRRRLWARISIACGTVPPSAEFRQASCRARCADSSLQSILGRPTPLCRQL